ncbi:MAG: metal-sensitive transcriptional regulator [Lachnospiraceae bacterium]|nr:metal-sensitive transcriptional regulator [Lachnospiraceae bacterium]
MGNINEMHAHVHDPEEKKKQINRISRIIGHMEHVKKMIEADEDCADVLVQLTAVKSALSSLGKEIIKEHTVHCVAHAIEDGDTDRIQEFVEAMQKYLDV